MKKLILFFLIITFKDLLCLNYLQQQLRNLNFNTLSLYSVQNKKSEIKKIVFKLEDLNNLEEIKKIILNTNNLDELKKIILFQYDIALFAVKRIKFDLWIADFIAFEKINKITDKKILDYICPGYIQGKELSSDQTRKLWLYVLLLNNQKANTAKNLKDFYDYIFIITEFLHDVKSSKIDYLKSLNLPSIKQLLIQNLENLYELYGLLKTRNPALKTDQEEKKFKEYLKF